MTTELLPVQPSPIDQPDALLHLAADYIQIDLVVSRASTIDVRQVTYTVPWGLQGKTLRVHLYDHHLIAYLNVAPIFQVKRLHSVGNQRARSIDYHHVISHLLKRPQALRYASFRKAWLPSLAYHVIWCALSTQLSQPSVCQMMADLLRLSIESDCETALAQYVLELLDDNQPIVLRQLQDQFKPNNRIKEYSNKTIKNP